MRRLAAIPLTLACAAALAACGTTEKKGSVGDELSAKGLKVTVDRVDRSPPQPRRDITGLSKPAPGKRLVGAHVKACSDHGGALGPYDFGVEPSDGDGELKYPARNYRDAFESIRDDCGDGWVVFEIPADAKPERITFGFEDTGTSQRPQTAVDARFSWKVE